MNKAFLVGNLTRDPELTTTANGISVCRFTIAVSRRFANSEGEREADFINCIAWRGLADNVAKYVKKGKKVCVVGSIQTRSYDAQDGSKRYVTEIVAENVEFLGRANSSSNDDEYSAPVSQPKTSKPAIDKLEPIEDDELPF